MTGKRGAWNGALFSLQSMVKSDVDPTCRQRKRKNRRALEESTPIRLVFLMIAVRFSAGSGLTGNAGA
jgi:hypothetical protein